MRSAGHHERLDAPSDRGRDDVVVIAVGQRYFAGLKNGRMLTAWSLAGALLFGGWQTEEIGRALRAVEKRKRPATVMRLSVAPREGVS